MILLAYLRLPSAFLLTDVFVPILRIVLDKLVHQLLAIFALQDYHLDALLHQVLFAANEGLVLA